MTTYMLATPNEDAALKALLRENAVPSWVSMSIEREPSYFAGCNRFGRDWAVIACDEDGNPVGMYACAEQSVYCNGSPNEIGYIGALRVNHGYRNRIRILRDGFSSIPRFSQLKPPRFWYTAIASDNERARRVLTANLPGMPKYHYINDLMTIAIASSRQKRHGLWRPIRVEEMDSVISYYNGHAQQYQFAPALDPKSLLQTGARFFVFEQNGKISGTMALWNQQPYKQIVAKAYRSPLQQLLPLYNTYALLSRRVPLPSLNRPLDQTYQAFLAITPNSESDLVRVMEDALSLCPTSVMTLGLHASNPWLRVLTRYFKPLTYRTGIYTVSYDDNVLLDGRPAQPEVAVL